MDPVITIANLLHVLCFSERVNKWRRLKVTDSTSVQFFCIFWGFLKNSEFSTQFNRAKQIQFSCNLE